MCQCAFHINGSCACRSRGHRTVRKYSAEDFAGDAALKGEFVRQVLASDLPDERKSEIIAVGLKALAGREVD